MGWYEVHSIPKAIARYSIVFATAAVTGIFSGCYIGYKFGYNQAHYELTRGMREHRKQMENTPPVRPLELILRDQVRSQRPRDMGEREMSPSLSR